MYEYMKDELWSPPAAPGDRSLYKCVSMTVTMFRLHNCAGGCSAPTPPPRISPEPESGVTENVP